VNCSSSIQIMRLAMRVLFEVVGFGAELPLAARGNRTGERYEYQRELFLAASTMPRESRWAK
jgi:hypothetical protein